MRRRPAPKTTTVKITTSKPATKQIPVSRDEIAQEAFRMFQARHGAPGDPVADWFEAERIVRSRIESKSPNSKSPNANPSAPKAAEASASAGSGRNSGRPMRRTTRRRK